MALLEIRNLTKRFGGLTAVDGMDFDIRKGEVVGLIGPNGAGKTTLFNMIGGVFPPTDGKIIFQNEEITRLKPDAITKRGITRTFQSNILFSNMTVRQNVILGRHFRSKIGFWGAIFNTPFTRRKEDEDLKKAEELLEFVGLREMGNELAADLPHGHQRLLSLCVALATEPELLLLDEPTTGMNPEETDALLARIHDIRARGSTIFLVEHDMRVVMGICEKVVVLNFGRKIAEGPPEEVKKDKRVAEAYLGTEYVT
ncbi:MAG: ABC transporter ATP-binding protein [Thermodesulfobacteriota bacterium]|nr:ABC transporter ATP-binding protein [Thermodesulfobacteriota bacterium]